MGRRAKVNFLVFLFSVEMKNLFKKYWPLLIIFGVVLVLYSPIFSLYFPKMIFSFEFKKTPIRLAADLISLLSLIFLFVLLFGDKRLRHV